MVSTNTLWEENKSCTKINYQCMTIRRVEMNLFVMNRGMEFWNRITSISWGFILLLFSWTKQLGISPDWWLVLGHWANVKQLLCVSELYTFSSLARVVALHWDLSPRAGSDSDWDVHISEKRNLNLTTPQTSWGAKQSMRAHVHTML